jgi:O-acetylserine/cysteine efflux transporter
MGKVNLTIFFCSSILAYSLWYGLIHRHGINRLAGFVLLQPIFTLTFGYILLRENLTPWQLFGSVITLSSIYIYNQQNKTTKTDN